MHIGPLGSVVHAIRADAGTVAAIVDSWRDDFPKYAARRDLTRMLRVFHFTARHPGRKVKYSNVSPDDQSATLRHPFPCGPAGAAGAAGGRYRDPPERRHRTSTVPAALPAAHLVERLPRIVERLSVSV